MELLNSTDYPNYFLRRLVSWVAKQVDYPVREIRKAEFRNSTEYLRSGRAWLHQKRILVRVGPENRFPGHPYNRGGVPEWPLRRIHALIEVTAHELCHLDQERRVPYRGGKRLHRREREPNMMGRDVMIAFLEKEDELMAQWMEPPKRAAKPKKSAVEKREEAARANLANWERKLKLAKTKVRKYKQKVKYYDNRNAARSGD